MGRPATPIGSYGLIAFNEHQARAGKRIIARAHFRDTDGVNRPVSASGRTQTIAQNALLAKLQKRGARGGAGTIRSTTRIGDLVQIYTAQLDLSTRLKPQTKARYMQSAKGAISRAFPEVSVAELSVGMVESFITGLAHAGHISEARNCRVVLRAMLRMAVVSGAIQVNPVVSADIRLPSSLKSARALTLKELDQLRNLVANYRTGPGVRGPRQTPDLKDALDIMIGTGLRISEVLALRAEDIAPTKDGRTILSVAGTIIYESGVGAVRQATPKSSKGRTLTIAPWVAATLEDRAKRSQSGLLWETQRSARPYQQQNLLRDLRSIVKDTDLEWVTSHALRKTAGTVIARTLGVSAATSALGHASDAITRRIYIDESQNPTDISAALASFGPLPTDQSTKSSSSTFGASK